MWGRHLQSLVGNSEAQNPPTSSLYRRSIARSWCFLLFHRHSKIYRFISVNFTRFLLHGIYLLLNGSWHHSFWQVDTNFSQERNLQCPALVPTSSAFQIDAYILPKHVVPSYQIVRCHYQEYRNMNSMSPTVSGAISGPLHSAIAQDAWFNTHYCQNLNPPTYNSERR